MKLSAAKYGDTQGSSEEVWAVPVGKTGEKDKNGDDIIIPVRIKNTKSGGLTVSKTVTGDAGNKNQAFTFTVQLSDTRITGKYGEMQFKKGKATFTLKHGESKTAEGLPAAVSYTVKESDNDGYLVTKEGDTGVIPADDTATAKFINDKSEGETPEDTPPDDKTPPDEENTPPDDETPPDEERTPPEQGNVPQTGETSSLGLWLAAAGLSLTAIPVIVLVKRRSKR